MTKRLILMLICLTALQVVYCVVMWDQPVTVCSYDNIYFRGNGTATSDGCHILVWRDSSGSQSHFWLQKFNSQHQPQWPVPAAIPFLSITDTRVVETSDHNYLVFSDGGNYTYAWKLSSNGTHLWSTSGVVVFNSYQQIMNLDIKADHNGGAYLTWAEQYYSDYYQAHVQHLDSNGNTHSFNGFIINPSPPSINFTKLIVLPDDDIILTCLQDSLLILMRLNPDFSTQWAQQLNAYPNTRPGLADSGDGFFYLTATSQTFIRAFRYSYEGVALWSSPAEIATAPGYPYSFSAYYTQQFSPTVDSSLVVLWTDTYRVWVQKLNSQGQAQWQAGGLQALDFSRSLYAVGLADDGSGGCYITANHDQYVNGQIHYPIYAQHVFSSGVQLPQQVLVRDALASLSLGSGYAGYITNGNLLLYWMDYATDSGGIYHQVMDGQGNLLLPETDIPFLCGSVGQIPNIFPLLGYCAVPSLQNTMVVWLERNILSYSGYNRFQICYQIINPAGVPLFSEGRRTLLTGGEYSSSSFKVLATPDGNTLIAWFNNGIKAQLLDPNGNQLWEPNGRLIIPGAGMGNLAVTCLDGAIYFIWNKENSQGRLRIYGQKLVNGILQWPAQGLQLVADYPDQPDYDQHFYDFNRGLIFLEQGNIGVYVLPLDTANDPPSSCVLWGQPLAALPTPGYGQSYVRSHPLLENLLVQFSNFYSYWDGHEWYTETYPRIQIVNSEGDTLAGAAGAYWELDENIVIRNLDIYSYRWYHNAFIWRKAAADYSQDYVHVFNFPGSEIISARVEAMQNGFFPVLACVQRNDGYHFQYFYIDQQGNCIMPVDTDFFNNPDFFYYDYFVNGNCIYPVWGNILSGVDYCSALYLQRISDGGVGVSDETYNPKPVLSLSASYPNPFSASANLSLNLKTALDCKLAVYNTKGQLVSTIHNGRLDKGSHLFAWDGRNQTGNPVADGIYFFQLQTGFGRETVKLLKLSR